LEQGVRSGIDVQAAWLTKQFAAADNAPSELSLAQEHSVRSTANAVKFSSRASRFASHRSQPRLAFQEVKPDQHARGEQENGAQKCSENDYHIGSIAYNSFEVKKNSTRAHFTHGMLQCPTIT
jgi:hypothetical protein